MRRKTPDLHHVQTLAFAQVEFEPLTGWFWVLPHTLCEERHRIFIMHKHCHLQRWDSNHAPNRLGWPCATRLNALPLRPRGDPHVVKLKVVHCNHQNHWYTFVCLKHWNSGDWALSNRWVYIQHWWSESSTKNDNPKRLWSGKDWISHYCHISVTYVVGSICRTL